MLKPLSFSSIGSLVMNENQPSTVPWVSGVGSKLTGTLSILLAAMLLALRNAAHTASLSDWTPIFLPIMSWGVCSGLVAGDMMANGFFWYWAPMHHDAEALLDGRGGGVERRDGDERLAGLDHGLLRGGVGAARDDRRRARSPAGSSSPSDRAMYSPPVSTSGTHEPMNSRVPSDPAAAEVDAPAGRSWRCGGRGRVSTCCSIRRPPATPVPRCRAAAAPPSVLAPRWRNVLRSISGPTCPPVASERGGPVPR